MHHAYRYRQTGVQSELHRSAYELTLMGDWISVKYGQSDPRFVPVQSISWMAPLKAEDMGPKETPKRGRKPKIKAVADEPAKQAV